VVVMSTEEKIKALEEELQEVGEEIRQILLDIRCYLMEAYNPLKQTKGKQASSGK